MARITKIEIKNFFGKGNLEWNLFSDVNILGGKNGGGKTTILQICNDLLTSDGIADDLNNKYKSICDKVIITLSNGWTITWGENFGYTVVLSGNYGICNNFLITDEHGKKRSHIDLHECITLNMVNSFEQHVENVKKYDIQQTYRQMNNPTMLDLLIQDQINLRNKDIAETMEQFLETPNSFAQESYSAMTKEVYNVLNDFFSDYDGKLNSKFIFQRNGNSFGYDALSMGEKQILLLILAVGNMKHQECVLLMDEPDLSMHVDWKKRLVKALNSLNPNMQLIITTHAPSLVRGWYDKVKEISELFVS